MPTTRRYFRRPDATSQAEKLPSRIVGDLREAEGAIVKSPATMQVFLTLDDRKSKYLLLAYRLRQVSYCPGQVSTGASKSERQD